MEEAIRRAKQCGITVLPNELLDIRGQHGSKAVVNRTAGKTIEADSQLEAVEAFNGRTHAIR